MTPTRGHRARLAHGVDPARCGGPSAKYVLLTLEDHVGRDGARCVVGMRTLARETGLSDSTVRRALHALAEAGLVTIETRTRHDGSRASSGYRLEWQAIERAQPAQLALPFRDRRTAPALPRRARRFDRGPLSPWQGGSEPPIMNQKNNDEARGEFHCAPESPSSSLLIAEGFTEPEAHRLAAQAGDWGAAGGIASAIEGSRRARNPRGFIVAAIRGRWDPPADLVAEREKRARAERNAELVQRQQAERVAALREHDARVTTDRARVDAFVNSLDPADFERRAHAALDDESSFMREYVRRKRAHGARLIDLIAVRALVWRAAGSHPTPVHGDAAHATPEEIRDSRTGRDSRRAHHEARPQAHEAQGREAGQAEGLEAQEEQEHGRCGGHGERHRNAGGLDERPPGPRDGGDWLRVHRQPVPTGQVDAGRVGLCAVG